MRSTNYLPSTPRTLEESCEYSGPRLSPINIFSPLQLGQHGHHHHAKAIVRDQTIDEKRARQHTLHSTLLDTRRGVETRATQEHPVSNYKRGAQDPPSYLRDHSDRSWPRTDRIGLPLLLPYMPAGITGMSE